MVPKHQKQCSFISYLLSLAFLWTCSSSRLVSQTPRTLNTDQTEYRGNLPVRFSDFLRPPPRRLDGLALTHIQYKKNEIQSSKAGGKQLLRRSRGFCLWIFVTGNSHRVLTDVQQWTEWASGGCCVHLVFVTGQQFLNEKSASSLKGIYTKTAAKTAVTKI